MSEEKKRIIFCRIGWQKNYDGNIDDTAQDSGTFTENNIGFEFYNGKSYDGVFYGYAKTQGRIHFEKIERGYSTHKETMENVIVVFFSNKTVVGWYENATLYRDRQNAPDLVMKEREFKNINKFIAKTNIAKFLPEHERTFEIAGAGQNDIFYGTEILKNKVMEYIRENSK